MRPPQYFLLFTYKFFFHKKKQEADVGFLLFLFQICLK